MSWAPHWTILCLAADEDGAAANGGLAASPPESVRVLSPGVDFAKAHLTLALNMNVPMAVVVTKFDLASKASLQKTLSKILTAVKDSGRVPRILQPDQKAYDPLRAIPPNDYAKAQEERNLQRARGLLRLSVIRFAPTTYSRPLRSRPGDYQVTGRCGNTW